MLTFDLLAMTSLKASRIGLSGVVACAVFWLLAHMLIWRVMRNDFKPEIYVSTGFCVLSYLALVIAAMLSLTIPGMIVAYIICYGVIFTASHYFLSPGYWGSALIAMAIPFMAEFSAFLGNRAEAFLLENALK